MPDENGNPTAAERTVAQARMNGHAAQRFKDMETIVDIGHKEYGRETFDSDSQTVMDKLGNLAPVFAETLRSTDNPHRLVKHLADNRAELDQIAKLPPQRQATALARIEARWASHGHLSTSAEPAWKSPEMRGRVADADWKHSYGDNLGDKAFDKEFWRRQKERKEMKRGGW